MPDPIAARPDHFEALRDLYETTVHPDLEFAEKVSRLLTLGTELFQLPLGILARVNGSNFIVEYVCGPDWVPPPGTIFDVEKTYCTHTLAAGGPTSFHDVAGSEIREHACYKTFGLESYIGVPIFVDGRQYGTLSFAGTEAHAQRFSEIDHTLIQLCGQWLSAELMRTGQQRELRKQNELFEALFRSVPDALVIADERRSIQMANPAMTRIFGYFPDELIGRPTSLLYESQEEYERQGRLRFNRDAEEQFSSYEVYYRRKSGEVFPGETVGAPIRDRNGNFLGLLAAIRDATDRKVAESAKAEFVSVVSHELRTPLTSIIGALGLIQSGATGGIGEPTLEMLAVARDNSERLFRLVNDILDIEKAASGGMEYAMDRVDIGELAANAIEEYRSMADEMNVAFALEPFEGKVYVNGDRGRLMQVLANLLSNAAKFSPNGGVVRVVIADQESVSRISVIDTGAGIPDEFMDRLFDKFTQADSGDARQKSGTGLGLNISKSIVEAHGGKIEVQSTVGQGSTFSVLLPKQE